ncbi:flavin-nucleotide-binding protein [Lysobacter soli]|uniref:pyridoxamine 5'-phosphate oxidase family protein n=1 Tax=Lysobacter soli TaxID=453783 RepID=UPI0012EEA77D|nr:pyridoxamine 5'-phosphate oxidase family protein [Lysobacter soli]QGW65076.1 flavin-nucleotide-binding protein [Lysobacter soli]
MHTNESQPSPWHDGERAMQATVGVVDRMEAVGKRVMRDYMLDQHREFFEKQSRLMVGLVDADGWPWATIIEGAPGFIQTPSPRRLAVQALPSMNDPAFAGFREGACIGLLGLEFHTRRRNRLNGRIEELNESGFSVEVVQSYGNCPQYIQTRTPIGATVDDAGFEVESLEGLDEEASDLVETSDTFFVASYADAGGRVASRQVDVSHRGGKPGFVLVEGNVLTIPDFAGNMFFNTLGNILETGRAGLLFADFANGHVLQVTGEARVELHSKRTQAFHGAERSWTVHIDRVVRRRRALNQRLTLDEYSPNNLMTGSWD